MHMGIHSWKIGDEKSPTGEYPGLKRMAEGIADTVLAVLAGGFSTGLWLVLQQYLQNRAALTTKRIDVLFRIKLETYGQLLTLASEYVRNPSPDRFMGRRP